MVATPLYLLATGARRRGLSEGEVTLAYYRIGPLPWHRARLRRRRSQDSAACDRPRAAAPAEPWLLLHGLGSVAATWGLVLHSLRRDCVLIVPELSALAGTVRPGRPLTVDQRPRLAALRVA